MSRPRYHPVTVQRCIANEAGIVRREGGHTQMITFAAEKPSYCSCDIFKMAGHCDHLDFAILQCCSWQSDASDIEQTRVNTCPQCGGPTQDVTLYAPDKLG